MTKFARSHRAFGISPATIAAAHLSPGLVAAAIRKSELQKAIATAEAKAAEIAEAAPAEPDAAPDTAPSGDTPKSREEMLRSDAAMKILRDMGYKNPSGMTLMGENNSVGGNWGFPDDAVPRFTPRVAVTTRFLFMDFMQKTLPTLRNRLHTNLRRHGDDAIDRFVGLFLTHYKTADLVMWSRPMWAMAAAGRDAMMGTRLAASAIPRKPLLFLSDDILEILPPTDVNRAYHEIVVKSEVSQCVVYPTTNRRELTDLAKTVDGGVPEMMEHYKNGFAQSQAGLAKSLGNPALTPSEREVAEDMLAMTFDEFLDAPSVTFYVPLIPNVPPTTAESGVPYVRQFGPYYAGRKMGADAVFFIAPLQFMAQDVCGLSAETLHKKFERTMARDKRTITPIRRVVLRRHLNDLDGMAVEKGDEEGLNGDARKAWANRWKVSGHWRRQWYPSIKGHAAKFIDEYEKGPEGAPLKEKEKVYIVAR